MYYRLGRGGIPATTRITDISTSRDNMLSAGRQADDTRAAYRARIRKSQNWTPTCSQDVERKSAPEWKRTRNEGSRRIRQTSAGSRRIRLAVYGMTQTDEQTGPQIGVNRTQRRSKRSKRGTRKSEVQCTKTRSAKTLLDPDTLQVEGGRQEPREVQALGSTSYILEFRRLPKTSTYFVWRRKKLKSKIYYILCVWDVKSELKYFVEYPSLVDRLKMQLVIPACWLYADGR
ncbi:hypothetical protein FISHEDRAFT_57435 [Fistulina hepatica ATCC 64428]|uniref:Uncharacterized protein n=1 Tax=Fistulina hepatica ATCC 64428 TaxID=1128425 RepID=A0A0D7AH54_9AGAR|nr:hypothetical protein FISHEDRAFT_57435 [Fistulina hepatica ATCC 64428]